MIIDNKYFELKTSGTAVMMIDERFIDIDVDECLNCVQSIYLMFNTYFRLRRILEDIEDKNRLQVHIYIYIYI